jgi:hypothetical protein
MNINFSIPVLDAINTNLARLVEIQQKRLQNELKNPMLTVPALTDLFALVTELIKAKSDDDAKIASLNSRIAATTANDAALNDPALQAQLDALKAAATAATVDPNAVPVVPVPPPTAPAAFDPTVSYLPGATVTDSTGAVWTAVTPVLGEAPGTTEGNWTLTTPAPAAPTS